MSKVINISSDTGGIVALCADGSMWFGDGVCSDEGARWTRVRDLPGMSSFFPEVGRAYYVAKRVDKGKWAIASESFIGPKGKELAIQRRNKMFEDGDHHVMVVQEVTTYKPIHLTRDESK